MICLKQIRISFRFSNIYTLFMAMSCHLLKKEGQFVFVTPRSWTSGLYFKRFRKYLLDNLRKGTALSRSAYMRMAALGTPPRIIQPINREQWVALSRMGSNLNQLAVAANSGNLPRDVLSSVEEAKKLLRDVRAQLIGG